MTRPVATTTSPAAAGGRALVCGGAHRAVVGVVLALVLSIGPTVGLVALSMRAAPDAASSGSGAVVRTSSDRPLVVATPILRFDGRTVISILTMAVTVAAVLFVVGAGGAPRVGRARLAAVTAQGRGPPAPR